MLPCSPNRRSACRNNQGLPANHKSAAPNELSWSFDIYVGVLKPDNYLFAYSAQVLRTRSFYWGYTYTAVISR